MRVHGLFLIVPALLASVARADDGAAARALIDQAILAHGGEDALAKWPVVTLKSEGIFHGYDRTPVFFFTSEMTTHGAAQERSVLNGKITVPSGEPNPQEFRIVNVLDAERGWVQLAGPGKEETREYTATELARSQESAYAGWLATLLPLQDRTFDLTLAGEEQVRGHAAIMVRVSSKGHRDVTLFFDKETRLLVKTETRGQAGTGVDGKVEVFLSRHEDVEGVKRPMSLMLQHDGQPLISHWVLEYAVADAPSDETFARP